MITVNTEDRELGWEAEGSLVQDPSCKPKVKLCAGRCKNARTSSAFCRGSFEQGAKPLNAQIRPGGSLPTHPGGNLAFVQTLPEKKGFEKKTKEYFKTLFWNVETLWWTEWAYMRATHLNSADRQFGGQICNLVPFPKESSCWFIPRL